MEYQLKTRQICLFFIAFLPVTKFFMLPSVIAETSKEDMWISALLNIVLDLITVMVILRCCKKHNTTYFNLLSETFGKVTAKIIFGVYFVYFLLKSILPIIEQKDYIMLTLYTSMPSTFYFIPFFIALFFNCTKRLRIVGRTSDVMWLVTLSGFTILMFLSFSNVDLSALLPIFANGKKIFKASYYSLNWFGDGIYLLFFMGEFRYEKKTFIKVIISFLIGGFMVVSFMIIFYCTFTSIAFRQQFALTEISKYTTVINSTGRFDYLGIILILFSNIFSLTVPVYFASRTLNTIFEFKKTFISPLIVIALLIIPVIILGEYTSSIEYILVTYVSIFFLIVGNILPILTIFIKKRRKTNEQLKV